MGALAGDLSVHPYGYRISTYGDPAFAESARTARSIVNELAAQSDPVTIQRMRRAFHRASQYEWMFWESAFRQETWPI